MAETVEIRGLRELRERLLALPKKLDRRVLNRALMTGARPIRDNAQSRAPVLLRFDPRRRPGTVKRAIRAQAARPLPGMTATVIVRVRRLTKQQVSRFKSAQAAQGQRVNSANNPEDPFYWWWLEFGTSKMPAQPFLRPAFEAGKRDAAERIRNDLGAQIDAEVRRLPKMRP